MISRIALEYKGGNIQTIAGFREAYEFIFHFGTGSVTGEEGVNKSKNERRSLDRRPDF